MFAQGEKKKKITFQINKRGCYGGKERGMGAFLGSEKEPPTQVFPIIHSVSPGKALESIFM